MGGQPEDKERVTLVEGTYMFDDDTSSRNRARDVLAEISGCSTERSQSQ